MPNFGRQATQPEPGGDWPTMAAVVPATDDPPTLARCVAALRASSAPPDELVVVESPPGAGPAEARNAGAAAASAELIAFVDADVEVHPEALERCQGRARRAAATRRRVRQLRRPPGRSRRGLALSQPTPPSRPHQLAGPGGDVLGRARRDPARGLPGRRRVRRLALSRAGDRGHRARHAPGRRRRHDRPRSRDPRHAPEALVAGEHGADRPAAARDPLGPPAARVGAGLGDAQPRLASPAQRDRRDRRRVGGRDAPPARRSRGARRPGRAQRPVLRAAAQARRNRARGGRVAAARPPPSSPRSPWSPAARRTRSGSGGRSGRSGCLERSPRPLRLGLVGCGRLAEAGYVPAIAATDGVELVAVADPRSDRRDLLASLAAVHRGGTSAATFASAAELLAAGPWTR